MRTAASALALLVAVSACANPGAGVPETPSTAASPTETASPSPSVFAEAVDIGEGRSLYLVCRGEGSPVVLFEAGDTDGAFSWERVMDEVAEHTRACAYDRAGIGGSSEAMGCRRLPELIGDLEALIEAATIPAPYVLVAASGGGFIASTFARLHPEDVAGMVFVDVPRAFQDAPPELIEDIRCDNPNNIERRDFLHVEHDAWDSRAEVGDIPVTIMSVDHGENARDLEEQINVEAQQGWLVLSPRAEQLVVTHTGHGIHYEDPAFVANEVIEVLEAARSDLSD